MLSGENSVYNRRAVFFKKFANLPSCSTIPRMMSTVQATLPYAQIVLAVALTAAILLQHSEAGLGAGFGGDSFSTAHHERRGFEKTLFYGTIVLGLLFVASTIISLLIQ